MTFVERLERILMKRRPNQLVSSLHSSRLEKERKRLLRKLIGKQIQLFERTLCSPFSRANNLVFK